VTEPDKVEEESAFSAGASSAGPALGGPSLLSVLRALIEDLRTLVEAETGYWRAALAFATGRIKSIAILLVLALFFGFFTLMALVVGLLLALGPMIGPWRAAGAVTFGLALLTGVSVRLALVRSRRMIRLLTARDGGAS
jgi:uncharacterized membrane protein YqjE